METAIWKFLNEVENFSLTDKTALIALTATLSGEKGGNPKQTAIVV